MPNLTLARYDHSSCTLGETLYVMGGDGQASNSIEKLDNITGPAPSAFSKWKLIQCAESFVPRSNAVFRAWNEREIVILGGKGSNHNNLGDGWVFDTINDTMRQVLHPAANSLKFYSFDNQS